MKEFLIFNSYEDAHQANVTIDIDMCMPLNENTLTWATPEQRQDGKWIIKKPHDFHMANITASYSVETFTHDWFDYSGEGE